MEEKLSRYEFRVDRAIDDLVIGCEFTENDLVEREYKFRKLSNYQITLRMGST